MIAALSFCLLLLLIPDWLKPLLVAVGLICALHFGYSFGRTVPHWTEDTNLGEYADIGSTKSGIQPYSEGSGGGLHLRTEESCLNPRHQSFGPALSLGLAIGCLWLAYTEPKVVPDGWSGGEWVFFAPIKWAVIIAVAGYVIARLTDKGPVGPLE